MPKLYIYPKEGDAFQFLLPQEKVSIGRSSDNDIPLPDPFCSGHHAFFYPADQGFAIRNNNSKNGTFVNGKRIAAEFELKKGDEIGSGQVNPPLGRCAGTSQHRVGVTNDSCYKINTDEERN